VGRRWNLAYVLLDGMHFSDIAENTASFSYSLCEPRKQYGPHRRMDVIWEYFSRFKQENGVRQCLVALPEKSKGPT
jgi:hypothetical protein